jgi:hypothetical protein
MRVHLLRQRKIQARFCCVECGYEANADLVAINVGRAGLARIACEVNDGVSRQQQEPTSGSLALMGVGDATKLSVRRPLRNFLSRDISFQQSNQAKHVDHSCLFLRRILPSTYNRIQ